MRMRTNEIIVSLLTLFADLVQW